MNFLEAILLGIIQGLSEFLPISSTAHLTLAGRFLNLISPATSESWTAFIAVLQLGTLAAVLVYFRSEIRSILRALAKDLPQHGLQIGKYSGDARMGVMIAVGTIPIVVAGLLLKDFIHGMFTKNIMVIAFSLIALAVLLWMAERFSRHSRHVSELTFRDVLIIGCGQALALIPGASRSGTTLTAGLFLAFARRDAARFSFLLSVPAILASGVYEMTRIDPSVFEYGVMNLFMGTVFAAISGYAAIAWLLRYLSNHSTMVFVAYRIFVGALLLMLIATGIFQD